LIDQFDEPRQAIMAELGKEGCYIHTLVYIAQQFLKKRIDTIPLFIAAQQSNAIKADCTVMNSAEVLRLLTGLEWWRSILKPSDPLPVGTIALALLYSRWASPNTKLTHFVAADLDFLVTFDPMGTSLSDHPDYKLESVRAFGLVGKTTLPTGGQT
jgi:hypothetical protein